MRLMMVVKGHKHGKGMDDRHHDADMMLPYSGELLEAVMDTVENPPSTWHPYLAKKDYKGIYEMESAELGKAFRASMEGKASMKDVAREIKHTFTAMLLCQAHKTHDEKA